MLAIDAVFAIRMTHDVTFPPVPLIVLFDVAGWKFDNDVDHCLAMMRSMVRLPEEASGAAIEALHYMQALEWISRISKPGFAASPETIVRLNEILLYGISSEERGHGFRKTYLPYKKGSVPLEIPREVKKLCDFWQRRVLLALGAGVGDSPCFRAHGAFRLHDRPNRLVVCVHAHVPARPLRERAYGSHLLGRVFWSENTVGSLRMRAEKSSQARAIRSTRSNGQLITRATPRWASSSPTCSSRR